MLQALRSIWLAFLQGKTRNRNVLRAPEKYSSQISLSHKPGTVETVRSQRKMLLETVRSQRKMLLEQGRTCENNATSMEDVRRATKECHNFAVKHAWD